MTHNVKNLGTKCQRTLTKEPSDTDTTYVRIVCRLLIDQ